MDKLTLYKRALLMLGERAISSLSEDREPRRLLDQVWDAGAVRKCLDDGYWKFALRSQMLDPSTDVTPSFGFQHAYDKPEDFVKLAAFCADEFFRSPVTEYTEEGGFWFSSHNPIYIKYVSDGASYGADLTIWPEGFSEYVSAYLAAEIVKRVTQSESDRQAIYAIKRQRLLDAKSSDAMEGPTQLLPTGSWTAARRMGTSISRNGRNTY
jgi:hypothetical protein